MQINLIVANTQSGVIGKDNQIPWKNKNDLQRFKEITSGSYVIMGRKTFESIGKPLNNRINIVISSTLKNIPGVRIFKKIEDAVIWLSNQTIAFPKMELKAFVIGGGQIYKKFIEDGLVDNIYQTIIKEDVSGDVFFNFDKSNWENIKKYQVSDNEEFLIWKRN